MSSVQSKSTPQTLPRSNLNRAPSKARPKEQNSTHSTKTPATKLHDGSKMANTLKGPKNFDLSHDTSSKKFLKTKRQTLVAFFEAEALFEAPRAGTPTSRSSRAEISSD